MDEETSTECRRQVLMDVWQVIIQDTDNSSRKAVELLLMTAEFYDRFMETCATDSSCEDNENRKCRSQLIALTCLLIASKVYVSASTEIIDKPLQQPNKIDVISIDMIADVLGVAGSSDSPSYIDLVEWELLVLAKLNWDVSHSKMIDRCFELLEYLTFKSREIRDIFWDTHLGFIEISNAIYRMIVSSMIVEQKHASRINFQWKNDWTTANQVIFHVLRQYTDNLEVEELAEYWIDRNKTSSMRTYPGEQKLDETRSKEEFGHQPRQ